MKPLKIAGSVDWERGVYPWARSRQGKSYTRVVRHFAFLLLLALTGCFHWAPITSLAEIEDARVQITTPDEVFTLEHATAAGHVIIGQRSDGASAEEVDASDRDVHVRKRKLDGLATGFVIGTIISIAAVVFVSAVAIISTQAHTVAEPPPLSN